MTAYVHIGTPKTGTTTIQKFLELNYNNLLDNNYLFPLTARNCGQHFPLLRLCFGNKKELCVHSSLERILETNEVIDKLSLVIIKKKFKKTMLIILFLARNVL
ncbi:hypothetical protein [Helicobacter burdigaliensis]|uniref:hypothetical protein n=1 Tax=Helicobacter burdigaliensis TaxID=2315334 RepID=UPI000EF6D6D2|nr:hypothetical protein [Helicobacter burdigaliensis]